MRLVATLRKLFGKRLRDLRTDKGYNQLYLATLVGVSEDFISLIERGINTPSFENIEAIAAALEVTVTDLFTFSETLEVRQRVRMVRQRKAKRAVAERRPTKGERPPKTKRR